MVKKIFDIFKNNKHHHNKYENIFYAFDFGSTSLKVVQAEFTESGGYQVKEMLEVVYSEPLKDKTVKEKVLADSVNSALQTLYKKNLINPEIKRIIVVLPLALYVNKIVKKDIAIKDSVVKYEHKISLINKAKNEFAKHTILHNLPIQYYLDGVEVKDPIGMMGEVLSMDIFIIAYENSSYNKIKEILKNSNLQVDRYISSSLAFINYYLNNVKYKEYNPLIIDFGGESIYLYNINHGSLKNTINLNVGSNILTRDISTVMNIDFETANKLKEQYVELNGDILGDSIVFNGSSISLKTLHEVCLSRYEELLERLENDASFLKMKSESNVLILLGNGHLLGSDVFLKNRWGIPIMTEIENFTAKKFLIALGALDYTVNNNIFMYQQLNKNAGIFAPLLRVVEDLF